MKWNYFSSNRMVPKDKELLIYYKNSPIDKGYIVASFNEEFGWKTPLADSNYKMVKWMEIK